MKITLDDIEFIDKTQLKSTLGVKFYKDNYSYIHIVKESDNCYEDSEAKFSEPNYVDINNVEEQMFVIQDIVGTEKDPSEYENNIEAGISNESVEMKFQDTEFKTEMLEISVTENTSDEEMVFDNESSGMFEENNQIKVETFEVYDPVKQNRKRKWSEALPHCKELRVVLEDIRLSWNEHNTQDHSQSAKDNDETFLQETSNDNILFKDDNNCSLRNDKQTTNSVFRCNHCTFETSVKNRLKYHTNAKHLKPSFNCAHCKYGTIYKSRLIGHINAKHTKTIAFNCPYCSFNTYFKLNLNRHINCKDTKKNVFNCSYCSYKTYLKFKLNAHVNDKHTKTDVFKCSSCNYETHEKKNLKVHINAKHTKVNAFACSYCSFKSYHKSNLNAHLNTKHTKTKGFYCSFCNYKTYIKMQLKRHINAHHTKVNVFICSYCNLRVHYKSTLVRHIKEKHS